MTIMDNMDRTLGRLARTANKVPPPPESAKELPRADYLPEEYAAPADRNLVCEIRAWLEVLQDDDGDLTKIAILLDKMRVKLWVRLGEELHAMNPEKSPTSAEEHWMLLFQWTQKHLEAKRLQVVKDEEPPVASKA